MPKKVSKISEKLEKKMKKILIVDDSALMRRVYYDIIESDKRFQVENFAKDGVEALEFLRKKKYDAVILDVNMPNMNGIQLLKEMKAEGIVAKVIMSSTDTTHGAKVTLDALELGAIDFMHKPERSYLCKKEEFHDEFLKKLQVVCDSKPGTAEVKAPVQEQKAEDKAIIEFAKKHKSTGKKIIAVASSTGGPKALQSVIPRIPQNINAPVLIVQHMPVGFTATLAERLNNMSEITVKEAAEGDEVMNGHAYLSMGGKHLNVVQKNGKHYIHYSDEPSREGVKPCANYMYESLIECDYDEVVCVVMTGMGADGTEGIQNLKEKKKIHVITQEKETCAVYGMPKSVDQAGLSNQQVVLDKIAQEVILAVGVR